MKVSISVPEEEISQIRTGQLLQVKVSALGGKTFEARVSERGVTADALSRSYEVKAVIQNPQHELLPGMIAEVSLENMTESLPTEQAIELPAEIIQIDADNRPFVWTVIDSKAHKAYVTLGQNTGDNVQISEGVKAGDNVICEGQQKVSNGMKVDNGTEQ